MSVHSDEVEERIRAAMKLANPDDIISAVKTAVIDEVSALSPDATVVTTPYFNHSYMPDLVLEWNGGKRDGDIRPIYLRSEFESGQVQSEVETLAPRDPVLLSLIARQRPEPQLRALRQTLRQTPKVLVTDVASLVAVADPAADAATEPGTRDSGSDSPASLVRRSPLLTLVQSNLLQGGRGVLTPADAERLTGTSLTANPDGTLTPESFTAFASAAEELFAPDAALRLTRAADLVRFGLDPQAPDLVLAESGQLSDAELRVLLPYLLAESAATTNQRLWAYIGTLMSLERLESVGDVLEGLNLSPLVVPNVENWVARRAQLVINSDFEDTYVISEEVEYEINEYGEPQATGVVHGEAVEHPDEQPTWFMRNRLLTADTGPWRIALATNAQRLRGRDESRAARWDELATAVQGFAIEAVDLRGLSRRVYVSTEGGSSDVSADVRRIRESIEDSFQVAELKLRRVADEEDQAFVVDFTKMLVTSDRQSPLAALIVGSTVLGYRRPPEFGPLIAAQ